MIMSRLLMSVTVVCITQMLYANSFPIVHSYRSGAMGIYSNAYIVELQKGIVIVDATLSVSSAKEVRSMIDDLGKPVYAILITHGHPDHYNGLAEIAKGMIVPIYSTQGVIDVITKYDLEKEKQWKAMFGEEWPAKRTFPNKVIKDKAVLNFESTSFTVYDLGVGESHSDSYWIMQNGSTKQAFLGDVVLYKVHAYLTDGHIAEWLKHLTDLKTSLKDVSVLYPGHGLPGGISLLDWQQQYLEIYLTHLKPLWSDRKITDDEKATLTAKMKEFLPNDKLTFLIGLGAQPVAEAMYK